MVLRTADVVVHLWPPSKLQVQNFGKRFPVISLATPMTGGSYGCTWATEV